MKATEYYDRTAKHYDKRHSSPTTMVIRKLEGRMLRRLLSGDVLDVGCGTGYHLRPGTMGLDISKEMLKISRRRGTVIRADATCLPFSDSSFDTVLSIFNVMNRDEMGEAFSEASRVLRNGGHFLLSVTSIWDNEYGFHEKMMRKRTGNTIRNKSFSVSGVKVSLDMYTKEELERLGTENGMKTVYFDSAFIWQTPKWGNLEAFSFPERVKLAMERVLPKEYGCIYFMAFRQ
ncbi:MAG: hypothetical protein DRO99_03785 [Candidatus Aenigmatarchaeota archaeon]|nr:MAG: hypothetical protein DRO99_03785 [Candidatus Aenigmarchaeota archaeon]